jgi:hypothetical protein
MTLNESIAGAPSYSAQGGGSMSQWNGFQSDQSEYSYMWDNPSAFQPQTFSQNTVASKPCNNGFCAIFFLANFVVIVALVAWLGSIFVTELKDKSNESPSPSPTPGAASGLRLEHRYLLADNTSSNSTNETESIPGSEWITIAGTGIGVGVGLNVVHFLYAALASLIYVKFGFFMLVVIALALGLLVAIVADPLFLIFPVVMVPVAICMYCFYKVYFPLTAAILQVTTHIICRFPGIYLVMFFQAIVTLVASCLPLAGCLLALLNPNVSGAAVLSVYFSFCFYWVSITLGYVTYLVFCGVGASWYFLNDTQYMPASPTWESFKRAWTTSFGSAAFAGFLVALVTILREMVREMGKERDNPVICIIRCILLCILQSIYACVTHMARYGLIYCAVFGVPFGEGCRRWFELGVKKWVDCFVTGNILGVLINLNGAVFTVGGALLGYGIVYIISDVDLYPNAPVYGCIIGLIVTLAVFAVVTSPIQAVADTILICFAESPEQLQSSAYDLYSALADYYGKNAKPREDDSS